MTLASRLRADGGREPVAANPVSLREPFAFPVFRTIWIAQFAAFIGVWLQTVGAQWYLTAAGATAATVALVQTATTAPSVVVGLPAGVVADLADRRRVLLVVQFTGGAAALGLAATTWLGLLTTPVLLVTTFALGMGLALAMPMWSAVLPDIVPRRLLTSTAMLTSVAFNSSRIIGPALGGLLVGLAGPATTFALNGVLFLLVGVAVATSYPRAGAAAAGERLRTAVATGVRHIRHSPVMRRVLLRVLLWGVPSSIMYALLPVVARDNLAATPGQFGLLLGSAGVGAILGVGLLARMRRALSSDAIVGITSIVFACSLLVTGFSTSLPLTLAAGLLAGGCWMSTMSTFSATVQLSLPNWVRGRGIAAYLVVFQACQAAGSVLWGVVADATTIRTAHLAAAALTLASAASLGPLGLRSMHDVDPTPAEPGTGPAPPPELAELSGPVLVLVEHQVPPARAGEFVAACEALRRSRMRTGARRWRLHRDVVDPSRWTETFELASGREGFLQAVARTTAEDLAAVRRVADIAGPPTHIRYAATAPTAAARGSVPGERRRVRRPGPGPAPRGR